MSESVTELQKLVDRAERLGVVGSPSSTVQLALDILGSAVTRKLVGELALFRFLQDTSVHYALGQITEIQLAISGTKTRPCAVSSVNVVGSMRSASGRIPTSVKWSSAPFFVRVDRRDMNRASSGPSRQREPPSISLTIRYLTNYCVLTESKYSISDMCMAPPRNSHSGSNTLMKGQTEPAGRTTSVSSGKRAPANRFSPR